MHAFRKFLNRSGLLAPYHFTLAIIGAIVYRFPSRELIVIGVTGTKGKSSTTEFINAIFEAAGHKTAVLNSIRTKIDARSEKNQTGRSMPGRFFIQRFLAQSVAAHCTVAILEMTSEGAKQYRHRGIALDAFVFLNLAPEHIESHGSYKKYADAKLALARQLVRSSKRQRRIIVNRDDAEAARYLALPVEEKIAFSLSDQAPYTANEHGGSFTFEGIEMRTKLPGEFSLKNALAAAEVAHAFDISPLVIQKGIATLSTIPGRAERIDEGQDFLVIVDYAHTPDSLKALCDAHRGLRKIVLLGSAGGGRDTWKRPVMGKTAEENADVVILTNDDPYDDDPMQIIDEIAAGMRQRPEIIPDRQSAIRHAFAIAKNGDAVLITGKGIDPIYGPGGAKIPWSDADVARAELRRRLAAV